MKTFIIISVVIGSTLFGTVVDKDTKESLVGVKIESKDTVIYTDFDGKFKIGNDTLVISYISYNDTIIK